KEIAFKMGSPEEDDSCDLVPIIFMYIMRNATSPDELSRIVNKHKDRMDVTAPSKQLGYQATGVDSASSWQAVLGADGEVMTRYKSGDQILDQQSYDALDDKSGVE